VELAWRFSTSIEGMSATAAAHPVIVITTVQGWLRITNRAGKFFLLQRAQLLEQLSSCAHNFSRKIFVKIFTPGVDNLWRVMQIKIFARPRKFFSLNFFLVSKMMTSTQIRQSFLDFFKSKQHTIVPSSSLMPDSPNLLFTNAGMNQFVPIFLGQKKADVSKWAGAIPASDTRAADTQKCIRAGGKHNDLDDVGLDTYHHTFFEMLGNWSFGDYFKKEAIDWAWELVVTIWKFPPQRLYATVYCPYIEDKENWEKELEFVCDAVKRGSTITNQDYQHLFLNTKSGDKKTFLDYYKELSDYVAMQHWIKHFLNVGLDPLIHIVPGNRKDNFWMMGETGPCGPCSELHVDLTPDGDTRGSLVNKGDARCIEIWNLVFIQFNANPDGTFSPLPAKHVDTGMGFERVTSIIQGTKNFSDFTNAKISNYETDIFRPIFDELEKLSDKKYGSTLPGEHTRPRVLPTAPSRSAERASGTSEAKYSRRNLPHFERPWAKYMVTFSTRERRELAPSERDLVLKSILYAHEQRQYQLYAACVMPDHVHLLFEPQIKEQDKEGNPVFWSLSEILQGVKSASAHNINKASGKKEHVWEKESMDRMIRGQSDMEEKFHYICRNPWDAGIVPQADNYSWLWTGEHTRPRVLQSSPSTIASPRSEDAVDEASTAAREGACAPPEAAQPLPQSEQEKIDIAFRVIADHIRTLSFAIADGIQPGNTDRNYVLRRILRRAVRYGRTLGFHEPFFYKLVDVLADTMGDVFSEIRAKKKIVQETIQREEEAFNKTLDTGIVRFHQLLVEDVGTQLLAVVGRSLSLEIVLGLISWHWRTVAAQVLKVDLNSDFIPILKAHGLAHPIFSGKAAFELYDTYGFPLDLTELMARERGLTVDKVGFEKLMEEQRARARAAQKKEVISLSQIETTTPTKFVGFDHLAVEAKVLEVVLLKDKTAVVLDASPFYAEMGGQVGDTGELTGSGNLWSVTNTQKSGNTFLHFVEGGDAPTIGASVTLAVEKSRRDAIQRHHTVTHLLHWALHEVASKEASQKGSFVGPDKLTFDFNSPPLTPQQISDIEKLVNEKILENATVSWTEVAHADVKNRKDVMQFFGDKYGDTVRVVQIGGDAKKLNGYSMELCGGTHTRATGEIGLFRILGESAIAAGVRRIEAVAGLEAYRKAKDELHLIKNLAGKINSPVHELEKKVEALLAQQKELEKQIKSANQKEAANTAKNLLAKAENINDVPAIIANISGADGDTLQAIADALKSQFQGLIVLGGAANNSVSLVANVSADFTEKLSAGKIIQTIAPIVGGKGGGKPDNARGGGKDGSKLDEALAKAKSLLG
jgi:alanyl-tRNA synthetase/REP element-mobilizing transposase RayT